MEMPDLMQRRLLLLVKGKRDEVMPSLVLLSRNRISGPTARSREADGMIIRHIVIKMYYMLILYYKALERNVNLREDLFRFQEANTHRDRGWTAVARGGRDLMAQGLQLLADSNSSLFLVPDASSTSLSSFDLPLLSFPCIALQQTPSQITPLFLPLSSTSFLPLPSCNFLSPVTRILSPVMSLQNHTHLPFQGNRHICIFLTSFLHHVLVHQVMWTARGTRAGKRIREDG
jgi:hypothetical protein